MHFLHAWLIFGVLLIAVGLAAALGLSYFNDRMRYSADNFSPEAMAVAGLIALLGVAILVANGAHEPVLTWLAFAVVAVVTLLLLARRIHRRLRGRQIL